MEDVQEYSAGSSEQSGRSIFTQLSVLITNSVIGAGLSYMLTLTLAKYLGPTEFGLYSHIMIVGSITSVLVNFSTDNTAAVLFAQGHNPGVVLNSVYSVRMAILLLVLLFLGVGYYSQPIAALGILAITIAPLNFGFLYEVLRRNVSYSYIYLSERLVYVALVFYLIYLGVANVATVFSALLLITLASCAFQLYSNWNLAGNFCLIELRRLGQILKNNSFLVLIALSTFVYGGVSRLVLEQKFGVQELGIYSAGWQITMAVTIFQAQVYRIWRVKLSTALMARDLKALSYQIKHYLIFSTVPVSLFALAVAWFTPELVGHVFGDRYSLLLRLLPIFCVAFPIITLDGLASIMWVGLGNRAEYLLISIICSVLLIVVLSCLPGRVGLASFAMLVILAHATSVLILLVRFYTKYLAPMRYSR